MQFYQQGRKQKDFETGIQNALAGLLVAPQFLFRIEDEPAGVRAGTVYRLDDFALASRLSFFLWSSIPDDELLDLATRGKRCAQAVVRLARMRLEAHGLP